MFTLHAAAVPAEEVLPELARSIGAGAVYCHGKVNVADQATSRVT